MASIIVNGSAITEVIGKVVANGLSVSMVQVNGVTVWRGISNPQTLTFKNNPGKFQITDDPALLSRISAIRVTHRGAAGGDSGSYLWNTPGIGQAGGVVVTNITTFPSRFSEFPLLIEWVSGQGGQFGGVQEVSAGSGLAYVYSGGGGAYSAYRLVSKRLGDDVVLNHNGLLGGKGGDGYSGTGGAGGNFVTRNGGNASTYPNGYGGQGGVCDQSYTDPATKSGERARGLGAQVTVEIYYDGKLP